MKRAKLLFIDPNNNHNKFYDIDELDNGKFRVTYGRVGAKGTIVEYPINEWNKKYKEKIRKGYKDITEDYKVVSINNTIPNIDTLSGNIKIQLQLLHKYAKETFVENYNVQISDITETLVNKAQLLIDTINSKLELNADLTELNDLLIKLFNVIPRKMKSVKDSLFLNKIIDQDILNQETDRMTKEQDLLDTIKGQLQKQNNIIDNNAENNISYLDTLGISFDEISSDEETMLKKLMGNSKSKYIKGFKVINHKTQKLFDEELNNASNKKTKLLFHGSRSSNWLNIIKQGLILHPNAIRTGSLFDNGIYFADNADKSLGYISGGRWNSTKKDNDNWLAVYEVHYGNAAKYTDLPNKSIKLDKWIPNNNFDSYFADKNIEKRYNLYRNEYIVYKESKCTIKYLIHI